MQHRHDHSFPEGLGRAASAASPERRRILREHARQVRFSRHRRREFFDRNLFGEPAWEILLTLYVIDRDQRRLSSRDLSKHANLALTTALRWLDYLEEQDLITRKTNPFDRRVVYVELSDKGRAAMDHYLAEMLEAALVGTGD
jgi:DNA-binding MarR family transcriptional regulator